MLGIATGLMNIAIMPILDFAFTLLLGPLLAGIVQIMNAIMMFVFYIFGENFIIGERIFENGIYIALTGGNIYSAIVATAFAIMVIVATWQIFKTFFSFMGLNGELEEPWKIGLKMIVFGLLIFYSKDVCELIIRMAGKILDIIVGFTITVKNKQVTGYTMGEAVLKASANVTLNISPSMFGMGNSFAMLVAKVFVVVYVDWKLIGFMFNIAQKYLNMFIYVTLAPIAFACGVSRATDDILKSWARLFAGGIAIQGMQFLVLKFVDVYSQLLGSSSVKDWSVIFIYFSLGMILSKLEDILSELGLPGGVKFEMWGSIMETVNFVMTISRLMTLVM